MLIACADEQQAIRLDEALWARPPESFVPHNWRAKVRAAVRWLSWPRPQKRSSSPRDVLISLRVEFADFATAFTEVIDFVPYEDSLKQLARERYKAYRVAGFNLNTATGNNGKDIQPQRYRTAAVRAVGKAGLFQTQR